MKRKLKREILTIILSDITINNTWSPFPITDTEVVKELNDKIQNKEFDYDSEPVTCCGHCKKLYIIDDEGSHHCVSCRTTNGELEHFDNIYDYLEEYSYIWDIKEEEDEQETRSN